MSGPYVPAFGTWFAGAEDAHVRVAIDHVLLCIAYLDERDVEGYLSLVRPGAVVRLPEGRVLTGHRELAAGIGVALLPMRAERLVAVRPSVVVATGTLDAAADGARAAVRTVADLYVLDDHGLIRSVDRAAVDAG